MNYHLFYAIVIPKKEGGVEDRVSERAFLLNKPSPQCDKEAIERVDKFQKEEELICNSLGRKLLMGSLIGVERGKVRILQQYENGSVS